MTTTTKVVAEAFAELDRVWCEYCGREVFADVPIAAPERAVGDHRIPRSRGGRNVRANLAIVCYWCNKLKADLTETEFRAVRNDHQARKQLLRERRERHA